MTATTCPQCAELLQFIDALNELLQQQTAAAEQHRAARQICGHRYARLGGTLTTCVVVGEHRVHDNGRGVLWAREGT